MAKQVCPRLRDSAPRPGVESRNLGQTFLATSVRWGRQIANTTGKRDSPFFCAQKFQSAILMIKLLLAPWKSASKIAAQTIPAAVSLFWRPRVGHILATLNPTFSGFFRAVLRPCVTLGTVNGATS